MWENHWCRPLLECLPAKWRANHYFRHHRSPIAPLNAVQSHHHSPTIHRSCLTHCAHYTRGCIKIAHQARHDSLFGTLTLTTHVRPYYLRFAALLDKHYRILEVLARSARLQSTRTLQWRYPEDPGFETNSCKVGGQQLTNGAPMKAISNGI